MSKKFYKIVVFALILLLNFTSLYARDFNTTPISSFTYFIKEDQVTIYSFDGSEKNVVIPKYIKQYENEYTVTTIGDSAFEYCDNLIIATLSDSVTTIGDSAFSKCKSLIIVTIPASVTTIGNSAFYDCDSLTSITIPDSVTTIGEYAFSAYSLTDIYCEASSKPSDWDDSWLGNCSAVVHWGHTGD